MTKIKERSEQIANLLVREIGVETYHDFDEYKNYLRIFIRCAKMKDLIGRSGLEYKKHSIKIDLSDDCDNTEVIVTSIISLLDSITSGESDATKNQEGWKQVPCDL